MNNRIIDRDRVSYRSKNGGFINDEREQPLYR
jgi:hypothetical protein